MNPHQIGLRPLAWLVAGTLCYLNQIEVRGAVQQIDHHEFTLPDGFVIEKVTEPSLVKRPIVTDFDDRGRLYVADSSGSNDKVQQQLEQKPHRIVRLEDTNRDGVFDTSVVYADGIMFPEGVLWYDGAVYCGAPPEIWRFEDTDDDGVADKREVWFDAKTLTGCANDLHGPYLGKDGWIYWAKGAFAEQTHTLFNGRVIKDSAAHIFRCLPDLSEFDSVMSGGMDNPVEVVFDDSGEVFFTTTFYSHPRAGKRDALVHALYGGVYPKEHGVLDGLTLTGEYLPAMTHLGPAAPSGLTRYESEVFGQDYRGNLFSTHFNLRRVQRHQLIEDGSTFRTVDSDFVVSSHHDFHPTDVLEDGDGSMLVVDTGGWYKLCCPTSQLYKPDVLGAIYRVRKTNMTVIKDPFGEQIQWKRVKAQALLQTLVDPRPRVREKAIQTMADRGAEVIPLLRSALASNSTNRELKQRVIWTLTRMHASAARDAARLALLDKDPAIVRTAVHSVGMHHDTEGTQALLKLLSHTDAHIRRKAADALGRIGDLKSLFVLLSTADLIQDRSQEHALIHAIIQMDPKAATLRSIIQKNSHPRIRKVALIALSQLPGREIRVEDVASLLNARDEGLRDAAVWVAGFYPEWGGALADHFTAELIRHGDNENALAMTAEQMELFVGSEQVQNRLAGLLTETSVLLPVKQMVMALMRSERMREIPSIWVSTIAGLLGSPLKPIQQAAIETVKEWNFSPSKHPELLLAIEQVLANENLSMDASLILLKRYTEGTGQIAPAYMTLILDSFKTVESNASRDLIVDILSASKSDTNQLTSVLRLFASAGPLQLTRLVELYHKATDPALGKAFLSTLKQAPAHASIRADLLLHAVASFPEEIRTDARVWMKSMEIDLEGQRQRLEQMAAQLPTGDIRRGQAIFKSESTACSACHQVGYVGGNAGPDLTRIGSVRTERDLLEAILFPSASFVRSYEPMVVETEDGELYTGVMHYEAGDRIRMVTGAQSEIRLSQNDIASIRPGQISVMPAGLNEQLSPQQLSDLVTFLKSLR